jgi:hypothetical protein
MKRMLKHVVLVSLLPLSFYLYVFFVGTRHDAFAVGRYSLFLLGFYFIVALISFMIKEYWGKVFLMAVGIIILLAIITHVFILLK